VTRNLRNLPVAAPIRSEYIYCNLMFTAASYLVEKMSGTPFPEFLEKRFFEPLGMRSTNLQPGRARGKGLGDRIATGYVWEEARGEYRGSPSRDSPEGQGAGSVVTSVNDYIRWVKAMMNREDPITANVYKGLVEQRICENPSGERLDPLTSPTASSAGLEVFYYRGHMVVLHDGSVAGFGSRHFFLPDSKFGGVILGNSAAGESVGTVLSRELIDEVLGVPDAERPNWDEMESASVAEEEGHGAEEGDVLQQLYPGILEPQPQTTPLDAYTGDYWNAGYRGLSVQVRDGRLFIDATDRSMGFTIQLAHICEQTKYIGHLNDVQWGGYDPLRAEFKIEAGRAVKMGLHLEEKLKDLIWFDRVR
jgi:hypothetical protein